MKVKGIGEFCGYLVSHKGNHKFCDHQRVSEQDILSSHLGLCALNCDSDWFPITKLAPNLSLHLLPPYPCQLYSGGNFPTKLILWKRKKTLFYALKYNVQAIESFYLACVSYFIICHYGLVHGTQEFSMYLHWLSYYLYMSPDYKCNLNKGFKERKC